ncbi:MAG: hypothetical protein ACK2UW_25515 [Anaerolineales bacterium]
MSLNNCVPSLLAGIVLGVESGIPCQVQEAFIATGTSHIIAIGLAPKKWTELLS